MNTSPGSSRVLVIAGVDPGGGAGLVRDFLTLQELGCETAVAISALTAQDGRGVTAVYPTGADALSQQIEAAVTDLAAGRLAIGAVKIGMLGTSENVRAVASVIRHHELTPVVLDPVLEASAGGVLLAEDAVPALVQELLPLATVLTPNIAEGRVLAGRRVDTVEDMKLAACVIHRLGPRWVLLKGGHLPGDKAVDILYNGEQFYHFDQAKLAATVRGTGCVLASALAGYLAQGRRVPEATELARAFVFEKISQASRLKEGEAQMV